MARATIRSTRRLLLGLAGISVIGGLALLDARTEAANPLTLKTITIDGDVSDWDAVLANPLQTTHDGDGTSAAIRANCALYSTDRDCPVGTAVGNDLYTFAWTYDASYVYLYLERYGGESTGVDLFFVADTNQDQVVDGTNDAVIHANWKGSTGTVTVEAGRYVPQNPAGDGIVSATGLVDGYDLPGNNATLTAFTCPVPNPADPRCGVGATALPDAGRKMELRIPWSAFGVASEQPFYWHAASSGTANLTGVVDNIGAPSGGLGSFVQRAVAFYADGSGAVLPERSVTYAHALRNDGNATDDFAFAATSSQGAQVELLEPDPLAPPDGMRVIGLDETGDGTWELTPQVSLGLDELRPLQVRITMPAGRTGQDVTRVTATSLHDPTVAATVTDTSHVGSPAFIPASQASWTQRGVGAFFTETLANGQLEPDTFDLAASAGCLGQELRLTLDAAGTQEVARDDTGDGTWDFVAAGAHTNAAADPLGLPDLGPVAGEATKQLWLWVTPAAAAPYGACTVRLTATSPVTGATASADHTVTVAPAATFTPSYTRPGGSLRGGVGDSVFFPAVIRNSESSPRSYALAQAVTQSRSGATARVWSDPNGDGGASDGAVITSTGAVQPHGGTYAVVIELLAGPSNDNAVTVTTTATADSGGATATQVSEADVGHLASYADPLNAQAASVFPPCATVFLHGSGLASGDTTSYSLAWRTPASAVARSVLRWPTTALGTADDALFLPADASEGGWAVELVDAIGPRDQLLPFTVELDGEVASLAADRATYRAGDAVQVSGAFRNLGRASLEAGLFRYTLGADEAWARTATVTAGATVTDAFSYTLPVGTPPGQKTLTAAWTLTCGPVGDRRTVTVASRADVTITVEPDAPAVTAPADGARLADSTPTVAGTAVAGATVTVRISGQADATVTADGLGGWSYTSPALASAPYTVTVTQTVSGVESGEAAPVAFTIDVEPPAVPAVGAVASPTNLASIPVAVTVASPPADLAGVTLHAIDVATLLETTLTAPGAGGTYALGLALPEGTYDLQATSSDDLGNTSARSAAGAVVVVVDRTPPGAPVVGGASGPVNLEPVPVTVSADAGAVVRLSVDGVERPAPLTEGPAGTFTDALSGLADGTYELTATATDAAGNVSDASAVATLAVDRAGPEAPVVDVVTSPTAASPVPIGVTTAEAGVTLALWLDGAPFASAGPLAGTTHTFALPLATGPHQLWVFATDAAGNESLVSNTVAFDVDVDAPAAPTVEPIATPTNLQPVPVTVTAEAGSTVRLRIDGVASAATPVSVSGTSYAFELTLAEATFAIRATAADALGNTSEPSAAVDVVVDRTKPASPAVATGLPAVTAIPLVTVTGTAEAGSTVSATVTGTGLVPTPAPVVATGGAFSIDLDFLAAATLDGDFQVALRATDAAGNVSDPTPAATVRLDRAAPAAPVVVPSATSASPVVVHVTAEEGSTVVLSIDGTPRPEILPASIVGTDYSFQVALATGTYLVEAVATDPAGNVSDPAAPVSIDVDNSIPSTPVVDVAAITAADPIPVAVTADAGMTVVLYVGGSDSLLAPTVAGTAYTFSLVRGEGTYVLTATAENLAGTVSVASAPITVIVDRTAPPVAVVTAPEAGASLPPGTIAIGGSAEPGATVNVVVDGVPRTTTADASGAFQVDVDLAEGDHFVTVTVVDPAGNASATADRSFVVAPPPAGDAGGGGCGCGPGGASAPEGLLLLVAGLGLFRRRRVPNPANL